MYAACPAPEAGPAPRGLLAFVAGFHDGRAGCRRKDFESTWKVRRQRMRGNGTAQQIADLAKAIIVERQERFPEERLTFFQAGRFES